MFKRSQHFAEHFTNQLVMQRCHRSCDFQYCILCFFLFSLIIVAKLFVQFCSRRTTHAVNIVCCLLSAAAICTLHRTTNLAGKQLLRTHCCACANSTNVERVFIRSQHFTQHSDFTEHFQRVLIFAIHRSTTQNITKQGVQTLSTFH